MSIGVMKDSKTKVEESTRLEHPLPLLLPVLPELLSSETLDTKTGLLTGLLSGKLGWKCPVALLATWLDITLS